MIRLSRHRLLSDIVAALLLATLLLRGLTPPGYMPGEGPVGLKLCTSIGLVDAGTPAPAHDGTAEDPDHASGVCSFAAAAGAVPAAPSADVVGVADDVLRVIPAAFTPVATQAAATLPWPRGPPALS